MSTRTKATRPKKTRKPRKRKPKANDNDDRDDDFGTDVEDYTKFGGFLMAVLGVVFGYSLVNSPWDLFNTIPKIIGIIFCLFVVFGGVLLLLPPEDRPGATDALVKGFTMTLNAIVTMGKEMGKQISLLRERRRLKKEKEEDASKPESQASAS